MIKKLKNIGLFHLFSYNLIVLVLGFVSQLIVAKLLSVEDIGYYKLIITYFNIITLLCTFGLGTSFLKKSIRKEC